MNEKKKEEKNSNSSRCDASKLLKWNDTFVGRFPNFETSKQA